MVQATATLSGGCRPARSLAGKQLNNKLLSAQLPNNFYLWDISVSGRGMVADETGNLFFAAVNSDYSGTTCNPIYNLSESIVEMSPDLTIGTTRCVVDAPLRSGLKDHAEVPQAARPRSTHVGDAAGWPPILTK